jgi:hypothetical protein
VHDADVAVGDERERAPAACGRPVEDDRARLRDRERTARQHGAGRVQLARGERRLVAQRVEAGGQARRRRRDEHACAAQQRGDERVQVRRAGPVHARAVLRHPLAEAVDEVSAGRGRLG